MVIKKEYATRKDGVRLLISYSDGGKKIRQEQTGILYDSAVDAESAPFTYSETDEPVDEPVDPEYHEPDIQAQDALDAIFGGAK